MKSSRSSRKARKAKKLKSAERPSSGSAKRKFGGLKEISLQNIVVRAKAQAPE